jgi:transposase
VPRAKNVGVVPLETIWEVPDELWERLEPLLERRYPRKAIGRPRADLRRVVNGVGRRGNSGVRQASGD